MTDDEMRVAIAEAVGWRKEGKSINLDFQFPLVMIAPNGRLDLIPDYLTDLNAVLQLLSFTKDQFDLIIRRHNAGAWQVEFTEPSHEVLATDLSLPRAICKAFLAVKQPSGDARVPSSDGKEK